MTVDNRLLHALPALREELAARAGERGGAHLLGERKDLEPAALAVLAPVFADRVEKDRKVAVPSWPGVGNVDVVVKPARSAGTDVLEVAIELKWGKVDEGLWDLFKMALLATRADSPATYLLMGASASAWLTDPCAGIFTDAHHDPRVLCRLRYPKGQQRPVWDWMLEGGKDRFPEHVPGRIRTRLEGAFALGDDGNRWDVRLVRVLVEDTDVVPFIGGWPDGSRPRDARRPLRAVTSRTALSTDARIRGCLLGGAVGDALGAGVEFLSLPRIREAFGPNGVDDLTPAYGRVGAITDDTQMTLFTAEGLLRAHNRMLGKGVSDIPSVVHHAYLRWLHTQGETSVAVRRFEGSGEMWPDGWLVSLAELHDRRGPGNTCLSALHAPEMGTVDRPLNDSKGCGAVMRAAPIGLLPVDHFQLGVEIGAITHGHPSGYLSAGFLACVVAQIIEGTRLRAAIAVGLRELLTYQGAEETHAAVHRALALAGEGSPTAEKVESLGEGWVGEEALAISLYCALVAESFEHGVLLAVNHSGDSDSTGAITGNLLGIVLGRDALPERWLAELELCDAIDQLADDVVSHRAPPPVGPDGWAEPIEWDRYPGW